MQRVSICGMAGANQALFFDGLSSLLSISPLHLLGRLLMSCDASMRIKCSFDQFDIPCCKGSHSFWSPHDAG
jgi:hypothetical protein